MARRATAIREQQAIDPQLLLLSAGDFSGGQGIIEMYRSRFLVRTMIEAGFDAVAVGERDLNYGIRTLKSHAEAGLPIICANLYQDGTRMFPPFVVKRIRGVKVGVIALLGEQPRELDSVEVRDPALEGRAALEKVRRECDCVILLAHMGRERLLDILPSLEGVDIVIRGHGRDEEKERESCVDTLAAASVLAEVPVFFSGKYGKNLGLIALAGIRGKRPAVIESAFINLDGSVAGDSATAKELVAYHAEERLKQKELQLNRRLAKDASTGRILDRYLGIEICRRCHGELMPRFISGRHFRAYETLRLRGETANPECLACHTTGYGRPGGYDPAAEKEGAPYLLGVQCEACHGPGTMHRRDD
ncbi:MAG: multiheme c-type cytochrome, partial [Candidatus Krumholzibacteriia bacterium]